MYSIIQKFLKLFVFCLFLLPPLQSPLQQSTHKKYRKHIIFDSYASINSIKTWWKIVCIWEEVEGISDHDRDRRCWLKLQISVEKTQQGSKYNFKMWVGRVRDKNLLICTLSSRLATCMIPIFFYHETVNNFMTFSVDNVVFFLGWNIWNCRGARWRK